MQRAGVIMSNRKMYNLPAKLPKKIGDETLPFWGKSRSG
jgi:hypothetical protein